MEPTARNTVRIQTRLNAGLRAYEKTIVELKPANFDRLEQLRDGLVLGLRMCRSTCSRVLCRSKVGCVCRRCIEDVRGHDVGRLEVR